MSAWNNFFGAELGAAAALAGLLFVAVSMNQARIMALGRIVDRGLETLVMLFLVIVTASLALMPGQPARWLGVEILAASTATLVGLAPLQRGYLKSIADPHYRQRSAQMVWLSRLSICVIAAAGLALAVSGRTQALYVLPPGILLIFAAVGINAWVLLIEINR